MRNMVHCFAMIYIQKDIVHKTTTAGGCPRKDCITTHPRHCAFDRITSHDDTIPRVRCPEFQQLPTGSVVHETRAGQDDTRWTFSYLALPSTVVSDIRDMSTRQLSEATEYITPNHTYLKTKGLSRFANRDRIFEFMVWM